MPQHSRLSIRRKSVGLLRRLDKNRDGLDAAWRLVRGRDAEARQEALTDFQNWLDRKAFEFFRQASLGGPKPFVADTILTQWGLAEALDRVQHLGALASLTAVPCTRLDYVRFVCQEILRIKLAYPGLGLGSGKLDLGPGSGSLTGLDLAQAWAALTNYGHLWGTFATERALLFALYRDPRRAREFINGIDTTIRSHAEHIFDNRNLQRFFYVLSAWRVSNEMRGPARTNALAILRPYLQHAERSHEDRSNESLAKVYWTYRRARQLAYNRVHIIIKAGMGLRELLERHENDPFLLPPELAFDKTQEEESSFLRLMDTFDAYHTESYFASPVASIKVLSHLREFKRWWSLTEDRPLRDRILALFRHPDDWPTVPGDQLQHFVRIRLPKPALDWPGEVDVWHRDGKIWGDSNFLLTPLLTEDSLLCDVFKGGSLDASTVHHVARILSDEVVASWTSSNVPGARRLWRSVAVFGVRLLQQHVLSNYAAVLEPVAVDGQRVGYAMMAPSRQHGLSRLHDFIAKAPDEERSRELAAMEVAVRESDDDIGVWLAFLGRVRIIDRATGRQCAEIDALWCEIGEEGAVWHFLEHKVTGQPGRKSQLDAVREYIPGLGNVGDVGSVNGHAAHAMLAWSGVGADPV